MSNKPRKIIYENQKEVHEKIVNYLENLLSDVDCVAYLVGSSITGEFGKYEKPYGVHLGSDMDLVVFVEQEKIPKDWRYLNTEKGWWKLYRLSGVEINGLEHKADAMIVKDGKRDFAFNRMKELGWAPERVR